jgi:hypothetical protein
MYVPNFTAQILKKLTGHKSIVDISLPKFIEIGRKMQKIGKIFIHARK